MAPKYILLLLVFMGLAAFIWLPRGQAMQQGDDLLNTRPENASLATFAGGCFWCVESEYRALDGVLYTEVGYTGGHLENPTYKQITTGETGHAEAINIYYDPAKISFEELLEFHLTKAHDPTQKNRQGVDVGPQYRSAIFYHDESQKLDAERLIKEINERGVWDMPIVTTLEPAQIFWIGEDYHQQYYEKYKEQTGRTHIRVLMKGKK